MMDVVRLDDHVGDGELERLASGGGRPPGARWRSPRKSRILAVWAMHSSPATR